VIYLPKKRLTRASEFVSRFTSSVSPVLDLYMKAYDAYYTDERYDRLYNDTNSTDFLQLQQLLNDLSTFSGILTP